jgi:hypothetical protein
LGVHGVAMLIHREFGWIFREQHESDHGIDALVETVAAGKPSGRLIALQIKSGRSWFTETSRDGGWILRGPERNLSYWLKHQLPVLVVLFDPLSSKGYWVHVNPDTAEFTTKGYRITVPVSNLLDSSAKEKIDSITAIVSAEPVKLPSYPVDPRQAIGRPVSAEYVAGQESDLVKGAFAETLANSLLLHHAIHEEPLGNESFGHILKACAAASGMPVQLNPDRGTATWDIQVAGTRWSLKTEAARGISPSTVRVEKLMEARWIRECTNPEKCAMAVRAHVPKHMAGYDRMIVLRAFRLEDGGIRYDLVEPPVPVILEKLAAASPPVFTKDGARESYGASINAADGSRIFRILLDSTVEKIRIWLSVNHCRLHGSWTVKPADIQQPVTAQDH